MTNSPPPPPCRSQIRAIESVRIERPNKFDETETPNFGLLTEMSYAEVRFCPTDGRADGRAAQ